MFLIFDGKCGFAPENQHKVLYFASFAPFWPDPLRKTVELESNLNLTFSKFHNVLSISPSQNKNYLEAFMWISVAFRSILHGYVEFKQFQFRPVIGPDCPEFQCRKPAQPPRNKIPLVQFYTVIESYCPEFQCRKPAQPPRNKIPLIQFYTVIGSYCPEFQCRKPAQPPGNYILLIQFCACIESYCPETSAGSCNSLLKIIIH